ncbi:MAG: sugar phosphate isomerase/epimerase [Candidatus Poribacteria bacterium]|nr:sugar phosphate isomerase/epimerase [Candidatus Poribacteria bacterium]MDE0555760.1 sugar phosphate isomerase/epimerase [Candidatus Poribacteria bacterium]
MKVGIRDGMLPVSFEESFQKAKEIGFDGVEVCMGVNYREHLLWQDGGIDKVNSLAEAAGVEIPSLSPGGFTAYSFMHPTDSTRSEGIAKLQYLAETAPQLGAKVILVPFFGNGKIEDDHIDAPRFIDGLKAAAETAEKYGISLAVESTLSAEQHQRIIDNVGSSAVGVYYDMGNATGFGYDSPAEIRSLGSAISQMHIKDTSGNHAGEGDVDFPAVFDATHAIGYDSWFVLETPGKDDPVASAAKNLNFVRNNF